jgi:hypothetical protein
MAAKTETLASCIVCRLKGLDSDGAISDIDCPFSQSQVGGQ